MRLLYVASDQRIPGRTGGSVHVEEVARGLTALGHEVHVVALGEAAARPYELHTSPMLLEHRVFRWSARRGIGALLDRLAIDAVMERYYNFGGEGVRAAYERGIPSLLEVNSPMREHSGSLKSFLDAVMLVHPMRRLREEMCRKAGAIVTPLPAIVPDVVPREKVHRVNWGANVEQFHPDVEPATVAVADGRKVVVFSGSFRPWHGADALVRAAARVRDALFLFVGDGPAWREARELADRLKLGERAVFAGAVPYDEMPSYLKLADIGVAPYQPERLGQMQLGFYWSPLKIFEYMAMGLPVVTLDVAPLREIVRPGRDGLLFEEGNEDAMGEAIATLLEDPEAARAMGCSGRERVVAHFSWRRHCEQLDRILTEMTGKR